MDLDLVNAAVGLSQAKLDGQVQILVAKKMLESEQSSGAAAVNLIKAADDGMDTAANKIMAAVTGLGGAIDVSG